MICERQRGSNIFCFPRTIWQFRGGEARNSPFADGGDYRRWRRRRVARWPARLCIASSRLATAHALQSTSAESRLPSSAARCSLFAPRNSSFSSSSPCGHRVFVRAAPSLSPRSSYFPLPPRGSNHPLLFGSSLHPTVRFLGDEQSNTVRVRVSRRPRNFEFP